MLIAGLHLLTAAACQAPKRTEKTISCEGVACTMMLAMVTVQVTDAAGQPITLDEAYTTVAQSSQRVPTQQSMGGGRYVVLDDGYRKDLANRKDEFRFIGMRNGAKVVDETYTISADCCHVKKESGKDVVVVR